jgi:hypothetical protein
LLVFLVACGGADKMKMASAPMAAGDAPVAGPPPLERSLFARDPNGQLSEDALQKILAAPIEIDLPARVGVLPIITATDWRGPGPDYQKLPAGVAPFVKQLRAVAPFTLVTEIMPIPSGALGMEALREIAARYRLRYLILYREILARERHMNRWAWGYATGVGALFLPGRQHHVHGYMEATLFDVKTGVLMFTTRRSVTGTRRSSNWNQDRKHAELESTLLGKFAPDLAGDVEDDLDRYARAAQIENERKLRLASTGTPLVPGATVAEPAP